MSRVTSKLQVTVPKAIAEQYGIRPGDDIAWIPAGDAVRVAKVSAPGSGTEAEEVDRRLELFDQATARQAEREKAGVRRRGRQPADRGWRREDLYDRGTTR